MPATSASSHPLGILVRNAVVDLGWEWSVVVNARIAPPRRHALNRMNLLSLNSGGAARLAFEGRVVELLDLLPAFRAYVQMSLPHAVFGVHGIGPVKRACWESGLQPAFGTSGPAHLPARS